MGLFRFDHSRGPLGSQETSADRSPAPSADTVRKALRDAGVKIKDLVVELEDTTVRIEGRVRRGDEAEVAVLVAGNLVGVTAVDDQLDIELRGRPSRFHTVAPGEDVLSIADRYYGSPRYAGELLLANRAVVSGSADVKPGLVLRIPPEELVTA